RALRAELGTHPTNKTHLIIETSFIEDFKSGELFVEKFAYAKDVQLVEKFIGDAKEYSQVVVSGARAFIPTGDLVDKEKEIARLNKELIICEKDISIIGGKLDNQGFIAKAPQAVVEQEKIKLEAAKNKKEKILESLSALK
ncbi:MAG: valine--tRNA ligase, partial [Oscillospiraceae bacterium]